MATIKIIIEAKDDDGTLVKLQRILMIPDSRSPRDKINADADKIIAKEVSEMVKPIFDGFYCKKEIK